MSLRSYLDGALFVDQRDGVRPPLLALHGWGRDRRDLAGIVGDHEALLPDLPGFGTSPPPPEVWGAAEYGKALAGLCTEHGHGPYLVVAHSFGGRAAVELAAANPELVSGMVLCGVPLVRLHGPSQPRLSLRVARFAARHGLASDALVERLRERYGSADYRAAQGVMRGVLVRVVGEDYSDLLPRVQVPVALCWGENDTEARVDAARRAAELLPTLVALDIVPGIGHDVILQAPDRVRAAMRQVVDATCAS